jgi:hypothetical protein
MKTYEVIWTIPGSWKAKRIERVNARDELSAVEKFTPSERAGWKVRAFILGEWDKLASRHLLKQMKAQHKSLSNKIAVYESLERKTIDGFVPLDKARQILEESALAE